MYIERFVSDYLSSNCYLIIEEKKGFLVDPCRNKTLEHFVEENEIEIEFALLTHEHADHIEGVNWIKEMYGAKIICSNKCAKNIQDVRMNYSLYFDSLKMLMNGLQQDNTKTMEPFVCYADGIVEDDMVFHWKGHEIYIKYTPGHSEGSICFLIDNDNLFCGDTLFENMDTVTRFKGGSSKEFHKITCPWLKSLPIKTIVYPGHFEVFSLQKWIERNINNGN